MQKLLLLILVGIAAACPLAAQGVTYNYFSFGSRLIPSGGSGATSLDGLSDVTVGTSPPGTCTDNALYLDTDAADPAQRLLICSGNNWYVVGMVTGSYAATMGSGTTWTVSGATHGLATADLQVVAYTESGVIRSLVLGIDYEVDTDDYDVRVTWATATAGRIVILKGGGGGVGAGGAPTDAKYWLAAADPTLSAEKNLGALADNSIVAVDVAGSEATPRAALYSDIIPLFNSGTCSGYLKSDGTCDTPSGSLPAASAYQLYRRNSDDTADEAATVTAGTGVTVTPSSGQITISSDCAQVACLAQNNAYLGNNAYAGTTVQTPSATQTLVAGDAITVSTITFKSITAASGITLTSTPTIADGSDGQELILTNVGGTNAITIQDETALAGSNLCLPADTNIAIAAREAVRMVFSATAGCWIAFK